jgi:hypothetical protein
LTTRTVRFCFALPFALGTALLLSPVLQAQKPAGGTGASRSQPVARGPVVEVDRNDSNDTRREFETLVRAFPPDVMRVLKLDPSLLDNQEYLSPYPGLSDFLQQHPEIRHNPGFFFQNVSGPTEIQTVEQQFAQARIQMWNDVLSGVAAFAVFLVVTAAVLWLTKLIVEQRRWNRISKIQADAHNKLLDKFATNEDLVAYIQTPAGRRFLESAPIPLHEAPPSIGAPYSRILWSLQAGVVLILAGLGMLLAAGRLPEDPRQFLSVLGVLTVALGAGFATSAGAAFVLSRRLGLFDKPSTDHA